MVGCWNCDKQYSIKVRKGINVPEHLIVTRPKCVRCGCDSLKPHVEYITEKEVMKDIVLHHRLTQMDEKEETDSKDKHDHYK